MQAIPRFQFPLCHFEDDAHEPLTQQDVQAMVARAVDRGRRGLDCPWIEPWAAQALLDNLVAAGWLADDQVSRAISAVVARRPDLKGQPLTADWQESDPVFALPEGGFITLELLAVGGVPVLYLPGVDELEQHIEYMVDDCFEEIDHE